jgi:hypothetical protein
MRYFNELKTGVHYETGAKRDSGPKKTRPANQAGFEIEAIR